MADYNESVIKEFRDNAGNVGGAFGGMKLLLLTTTGAKTGNKSTKPLAYTMEGDKYLIIASKGGAPTNPAWYYNIVANPEVELEVGTEKFKGLAEVVPESDRLKLYAQHASKYPGFNDYLKRTSRKIPVILVNKI